jgi:osmoprotectant transport system ATP-binding protein
MLEFEAVTRRFVDHVALEGFSLACVRGRTLAVLGPSGSGKSTLLRLAIGLARPDAGTVRVDGRDLAAWDLRELRHRTGYVIQEGGLFPHLDVRGNVTLAARDLGLPHARQEDRLAELLELVQLAPQLATRRPHELSGGQRQRVALMRALMLDPPLLLLDEPLAALDPLVRSELQRDLRALFRRLGKTVVIVTHDVAEAALLADEVALVHEGRLVQKGPLADLLDRPASPFVAEFVRAQRGAREILAEAAS